MALAGIATVAGSSIARGQSTGAADKARLIHFYATPDGESHHQIVEITNDAGEIPVTAMTARAYARSAASVPDWHTAPRRQFAINMTGTLEVEISDGSRHRVGQGDLVYLEDTTPPTAACTAPRAPCPTSSGKRSATS
jgi:quercetin dioxygenase-like cupin family protein